MKTEVIWTPLPAGISNGKLKLSVFVSHRLYGANTTIKSGGYTDVLKWPSKSFKFQVSIGGKVVASDVVATNELRPDAWKSFLSDKTPVKAYKEPLVPSAIQTLSSVHLASMVESVYQAALELHPTEKLPAKEWMEGHLAPFAPLRIADKPVRVSPRRAIDPKVKPPKKIRPLALSPEQQSAQLKQNYEVKLKNWRMNGQVPQLDLDGFKLVTFEALKFHEPFSEHALKIVPKPDLDYHQALSALGSFPALLRAFGFVFDLEIPIPAGIAASGVVEVTPTYNKEADTVDKTMKMAYSYVSAKGVFSPKPKEGSDLTGGMLAIGNDTFFLSQIDLDSAALKLANVATGFNLDGLSRRSKGRTSLPSLRSVGIAVHRTARSDKIKQIFTAMVELKKPDNVLHYDDVVRGYRVDVLDRGKWRSLCEREGNYAINLDSIDESREGWISTAMTSAPDDDGSGPRKLHECIWRWSGWSFTIERPGKHLDDNDNLVNEEDQLHEHFKLKVKLRVPKGSLPPLRFGRKYKMRARAVDLAGNSLPLTAASSGSQESDEITYTRFDPVLAPAMYPSDAMSFGEGEYHVVIRKFKDSRNAVKPTRRMIVPPEGGFSLCEQHGMFDLAEGGLDQKAYDKIIVPHDKAEGLKTIIKAPLTDMPYLVDPMARGARIAYTAEEFPNQKTEPENIITSFPGSWPKIGSITLTVKPTTGIAHPQPISSSGAVEIGLRPGEVVEADISSTTNEVHLPHLGITQWKPVLNNPILKPTATKFIKLSHSTENITRFSAPKWRITPQTPIVPIKDAITQGKVWLVTPDRDFTLVYATQIPEQDAALVPSPPAFRRDPGGTSLIFGGLRRGTTADQGTKLVTHAWSTDEVEAWSTYTDDLDLIEEPTRKTKKRTVEGTAFKVLLERDDFEKPLNLKHELGDTKHHEMSYLLKAHSRFRNYFDPKWEPEEFIRESKPITFHAPSTAKPSELPLQYIIPTFEWSTTEQPNRTVSKRTGNGLRVYIARPWFSSGNGERLAIILPNGDVPANAPLAKFITTIGADPIFQAGSVPTMAKASHFVGSKPATNLTLSEVPGSSVSAATYQVEFDEERQLWYADIEVNLGGSAYTPLIRMALARYQEHSLPGLELGPVAIGDFMQLEPDRLASVAWTNDQTFRVMVVGVTGTPVKISGSPGRVAIASVEEKGGRDSEGAWRPVFVKGEELEAEVPIGGIALGARIEGTEFKLPTSKGSRNYRLVIREYEVLLSDAPEAPEQGEMMLMSKKFFTNRRLIYMDVIPLSERDK